MPRNDFTKEQKVTLRRLLSHTAGLTVHGFPVKPAMNAVAVIPVANPDHTRSDDATFVEGLFVESDDRTIQSLDVYVNRAGENDIAGCKAVAREILRSVAPGTKESTFKQPFAAKARRRLLRQFRSQTWRSRWHVYPEMAAAGLWTTPSDLVRFAAALQDALAGKSTKMLSKRVARQMVTEEKDHDGLGVFLQRTGKNLRFSHNGRNEGFDSLLVAYAESGRGAAIMINANENSGSLGRILKAIESEYRWP